MRFSEDFIDTLKDRVSLSDYIGRKVKLVKAGKHWKGLSPFKPEKTPSFMVDDEKRSFVCYSSGISGDIISFVQETEGLSFTEAVEKLARDAGLEIPTDNPQNAQKTRKRKSLMDLMEATIAFYEQTLRSDAGLVARRYLEEERGLDEAAWRRHRIGFAPEGWQGLYDHLKGQGAEDAELIDIGVSRPSNKSGKPPYDAFRNRVIFPILDPSGRPIAMGGRALESSAVLKERGIPKYVNSSDTPLFHKSRVIYGYGPAREALHKASRNEDHKDPLARGLIVAEGYMDVIAMIEHGFETAVAPMGTALTNEQLEMLWRADVARLASAMPLSAEILVQTDDADLQTITDQVLDLSEIAIDLSGKAGHSAVRSTTDLAQTIQALRDVRADHRRSQDRILSELTRLHWLNVDIQDEVESLSNDLRFSIARDLENQGGAPEVSSQLDRFNTLQRLGSFSATAVTLLLQAAVTQEPEKLQALPGLVHDALSAVQANMAKLPDRTDYITLRHSLRSLRAAASASDGLLQATLQAARERQRTDILLERFQDQTSRLYGIFLEASGTQRLAVVETTGKLVDQSTRGVVVITVLIVSTGLFAIGLLLFYVYPGIVHPLTRLTATLLAIARGEKVDPVAKAGDDEIARMYRAVDFFRASIEEKERTGDLLREEIAEHRRTLEELRHTQADLVQAAKMATIGELSAGLSHELNQPINAMQHRLWAFGKQMDDAGENVAVAPIRERIDTLLALVHRMAGIVTHFKRFARRTTTDLRPVAVEEALTGAESLVRHRLTRAGVVLERGGGIDKVHVLSEISLLEQVILNLLTNAIDALETLDPDRPRCIRADTVPAGPAAVDIVISDTGDGLGDMSPDEAMKPFVTGKDPARGMGLGLSISYKIAKELGGSLQLKSTATGGTSAVLTLERADLETG